MSREGGDELSGSKGGSREREVKGGQGLGKGGKKY